MPKGKLPPTTFNVSPNALRPTESFDVDQEMWDRSYKLRRQGKYRTTLQEVMKVLERKPNDEGTLRLAVLIAGASRSDQLQAEEPIPSGMLGDTLLDPIFTQCSHCNTTQWISINWLLDLGDVTSPIGLQCQECGYVMCRDCLKSIETKSGQGYSIYSKVCPNCEQSALGTPVFPTGRRPMQMQHIKGVLSKVLIFREGPLDPDDEYVKEILDNVYPAALQPGVTYSAFPVSNWSDEISFYALGVAKANGIQLDEFDQADGRDMDGNRLYFMRIYLPMEAPKPDQTAETNHATQIYEDVQDDTPKTVLDLAHTCLNRKEYAKAIQIYRKAFSKVDDKKEHWIGIGLVFHQFVVNNLVPNVAKDTRIFALLGDSTLVSAETRRLWYLLIHTSHFEGLKLCLAEAERCFKKAVEISPGSYNARVFLGQLYEDMGFYDKALAEFDRIMPENEEERQGRQGELKYLRETQARDLDADLRPRPDTAAMPIHEMYRDKLQALLQEIDQNHNGNPSLPW